MSRCWRRRARVRRQGAGWSAKRARFAGKCHHGGAPLAIGPGTGPKGRSRAAFVSPHARLASALIHRRNSPGRKNSPRLLGDRRPAAARHDRRARTWRGCPSSMGPCGPTFTSTLRSRAIGDAGTVLPRGWSTAGARDRWWTARTWAVVRAGLSRNANTATSAHFQSKVAKP